MKNILLVLLCLFVVNCGSNSDPEETTPPGGKNFSINYSTPPIALNAPDAKFAKDVIYGSNDKNKFDIFLPASSTPTPLVVYIHGGGFTSGDKADVYSNGTLINYLIDYEVAFASINYRFLETNDTIGLDKPLGDSTYALQFLKYHASKLNIDPNNIVLVGTSSGAGTSLWIGLGDDRAQPSAADIIKRQSTKVKGVVAFETQATYDFLYWETIFLSYGFSITDIEAEVLAAYSINNLSQIDDLNTKNYRERLDILSLMDIDDPEIWVKNEITPLAPPSTKSILYHHPFHAKALQEQANLVGMKAKFYIPELSYEDPSAETEIEFILRLLGK